MRAVSIPVYNNHKIELFVERLKDGFELWCVGVVKGKRILIDHHLTRDDLEARLEYARHEDLIWRDVTRSEIPAEKHERTVQMEETIERKVFWDGIDSNFASIRSLDKDRKDTVAAKKTILGRWTDGVLTFSVEPNNKLQWSCSDHQHWLDRGRNPAPDWWNFSSLWELHLMANMNTPKACGTHVSVLHVDEKELHIKRGPVYRIVHVFHRVRGNESSPIETTNRGKAALK
jgi:hypothetical protein